VFKEISPNPYNISKPSSGNMFFGRQDVIKYVMNHISRTRQKHILVIYGERKIGKTSILYYLRDYLPFQNYIPVYISMQAITDEGTDVFFYSLSEYIVDSLKKANFIMEKPRLEDFQKTPAIYFNKEILESIEKGIGDRKLVLLFDEFERLYKLAEDGKIDKKSLYFLGNVIQKSNKTDFIFAGDQQLLEIMEQYWSALFNITVHKKVDTLSKGDTYDLIVKPVAEYNLKYQEKAKEYIFQITGGHPYFVQLVCSKLVDYYNKTRKSYIEIDDIDKVLDKVFEGGYYHFWFMWKQLEKNEKIVLAALAELENSSKIPTNDALLAVIKKYLPLYTLKRLSDTLDRLSWCEIIVKDKVKDLYRFKVRIIRMWIIQHQKLREITEEVKQ